MADRVDPRLGVFMTLIEALGWRESAICQLRAEDVRRTADADAPFGRIRKVGTVDKKRVERWLPMADEVRRALDRVPVLAGYLFPAPKGADKPWTLVSCAGPPGTRRVERTRAEMGGRIERRGRYFVGAPLVGALFAMPKRLWYCKRGAASKRPYNHGLQTGHPQGVPLRQSL